jgi:hypothetical protein
MSFEKELLGEFTEEELVLAREEKNRLARERYKRNRKRILANQVKYFLKKSKENESDQPDPA